MPREQFSIIEKGDLASAAADAEMALKWKPHLAQVWILLGSLRQKLKNIPQATEAFENVLRLEPNSLPAVAALGELSRLLGRKQEAINYLDRATKLAPTDASAWTNLGTALLDVKRSEDAAEAFRKALQISPNQAEAANNLGVMARASGATEEAIAWFSQAISARSDFAEAYSNLAACLNTTGEFTKAEKYFTQALSLSPAFFEALLGLGNTMAHLGRPQDALAIYQKAINANPGSAEAYTNLGNALRELERVDEARLCQEHAIKLNPEFAEAYFNLGNLFNKMDRFYVAIDNYENALAIKPYFAEAHCNLGNSLKDLGRLDEAESNYRKALNIDPNYRAAFDNLLFTLNYHPDKPAEEIFLEYRAFDAQFGKVCRGLESSTPPIANIGKRLRIGYVSPAFHSHSTRHFLEPLLANHDRTAFETFAYSEQVREDEVTARYRSYFDHWVATRGLSDDDLAKRIREDGIHILVDIAGHTSGNRLGVFARKPAPVSLHWLDFGYTTGLSTINYYLCDHWTVPEGADSLFSERPWRLPVPSFAYRPSPDIGEVSALPALRKGHITFGTLTRSVRINHRTIRVWAEILKRVEGSVLVIDSSNFREPSTRDALASRFENAGISRERVVMGYHSPPWDVLRNMDIGLDCFPHNSGTTLFEHLYLGVPFITLASRPSVGRLGAAILHGIGHPELVAYSEDEYVEKAVSLAGDPLRMQELRSNLRRDMQGSTLMDESGFARHVENAYLAMWQAYLQQNNQAR